MNTLKRQFKNLKPALVTAITLFVIMALISIWAALQLPADIKLPVHWNINGEPNQYAGKFLGLFMMPIVVMVVILLVTFLPRIEPRKKNINLSMKAYNLVIISIILVFATLHIVMIMNALGKSLSIGKIVPALIGVLFIVIGNYMGKIRSNFMLGIKTPWTLSSELSWNKTHRLGGRLFILSGFLIIISSFMLSGTARMIILLISVFGTVIISFIYSYLIWKGDPDKKQ
ncbi:MAG: SdpI family protein [Candidatus Marinimicrobia bacterium]|nr:SdpI family protein [Candidatus Neomarinimicrobiota bacterium]